MTWGPQRESVETIDLAALRPGDRLAIEVEFISEDVTHSNTISVWPLATRISDGDVATGHVTVSLDVHSFPNRDLLTRGPIGLPSPLAVGDLLDYIRLGQLRSVPPTVRRALPSGSRVTHMQRWSEPTLDSVEFFDAKPGAFVSIRGMSEDIGVFITGPSGSVTVDSQYPWERSMAEVDRGCDGRVLLGQPFRWRGGRTEQVVAIQLR